MTISDHRWLVYPCVAAAMLAVGACALPASAPVANDIETVDDPIDQDFFVVPLMPAIVSIMGDRGEAGFPSAFRLRSYKPNISLRPGDVVAITIYETGGPSLFGPGGLSRRDAPAHIEDAAKGPGPAKSEKPDHPVAGKANEDVTGTLPVTPVQQIPVPSLPPPLPVGSPPAAKTTTFPPITVESDGTILVPFVGSVEVAGLNPNEASEKIQASLATQTLKPQVLVSFVSENSNVATVGGEANRPGSVTLTLRGEKLLDVIGQTGGSKWPAPDTDVTIMRGGNAARVKLQTIIDHSAENIIVRPNDQLFLSHNPRSFTVLGASQKVSQYTFDVPRVSLAEAVSRSGGSIDTVGNPGAIYLFREEPRQVAQAVLSADALLRPHDATIPKLPLNMPRIKVVYKVDMNSADGYFLAKRTLMRDKDVVLIANAEGTQLLKFLTLARGVSGAASDLNVFGVGGPLGRSITSR